MASCQTCLGPLDLPINLFEPNYKNLLDLLQRLLAFQVYVDGGDFKVCWHCQGKLMWVSEFQDVCLKSVEPLRTIDVKLYDNVTETGEQIAQFTYDDLDIKSEHSNAYDDPYDAQSYSEVIGPLQHIEVRLTRCPRIKELISSKHTDFSSKKTIVVNENALDGYEDDQFLQEVDQSMSSDHSYSSVSDDDFNEKYNDEIETNGGQIDRVTKMNKATSANDVDAQKNPFVQECNLPYSADEMNDSDSDYDPSKKLKRKSRARLDRVKLKQLHCSEMEQAMKKMYNSKRVLQNMQCCLCDFVAKNSMGIKQHMTRSHKNVNNWCKYCNIIADDMEGHRKVSLCNLWQCTICEKYYKKLKYLKNHLVHHQSHNNVNTSAKLQQSNKQAVSSAINESHLQAKSGKPTAPADQDEEITTETEENADFSEEASMLCASGDSMMYTAETENQFNINKYKIVSQKTSDCNLKNTSTNSLEADEMPLLKTVANGSKSQQNIPSAEQYHDVSDVCEVLTKLKRFFNDSKYSQCIFCGYIGKYPEFLREHVLTKHRDRYFKKWCEHCNVQTNDLQKHREDVRCYKFECKFCKIVINNVKDLIAHVYSHGTFEDAVKTEFLKSGRLYYRQYPENQVRQAIAAYNEFITRKRFQCLHCQHFAFSSKHLWSHMRTVHKSQMANWCRKCNLQTCDLKRHLDTTLCIPRKCIFCVIVFKNSRLIDHLRLHCR